MKMTLLLATNEPRTAPGQVPGRQAPPTHRAAERRHSCRRGNLPTPTRRSALRRPAAAVAQAFSLRYAPVLLAIWLAGPAFAQDSITPVVTGGGGYGGGVGGDYGVSQTSGQAALGTGTSANYSLVLGFWPAVNGSPETVVTGPTTWAPGGSLEWQLNDARGTAGSDPGWDWLSITGNLTITATNKPEESQKFTLHLVTLSGTVPGLADHFNNAVTNSWVIATVSGAVNGFNANKFIVDPSGFQNPVSGGSFSVVLQGQSVGLVFTPAPPACSAVTVASFYIAVPVPGTTNAVMTFSNASGLCSIQALKMDNSAIAGTAYDGGGGSLGAVGPLSLTARTTLPDATVQVVLTATRLTPGSPATVNVLAIDTCGRGKSFDPVITTLAVAAAGRMQQRFEGLLSAERYLQVLNGTPGLTTLEVVLNGHRFRLSPLADGQSLAADLGAAMNEGDANVVVLTGYGAAGASAWVLITDQPGDGMIQLPELADLTLRRSGAQVVVAWPDTLTGWQLQACETLESGWQDVAATPGVVDGRLTVTVTEGGAAQFFRLHTVGPAAPLSPAIEAARAAGLSAASIGATTSQPVPASHRTYDGIAW